MSEKEKREAISAEKSDAVRFRDIVKASEDILKTAYPPEEEENEPINPFVGEKPAKNKLDADFSPDGKVLIEDNPERKKTEKERSREKERNRVKLARQNLRREKLLAKIKKLEPRLAAVREKKCEADGTPEFNKYQKKEARLSKKINMLNQRAVSAEQFTPNAGFYIKARNFKIWVIVLILLILIIITLSTALFLATYKDLAHFRGDSANQRKSVSELSTELQNTNRDKDTAIAETATLKERIAELEESLEQSQKEVEKLQPKAEFMDEHIVLVTGNFFGKTYHKYGCSEVDPDSCWAYNEEQVVGKIGYKACEHCID